MLYSLKANFAKFPLRKLITYTIFFLDVVNLVTFSSYLLLSWAKKFHNLWGLIPSKRLRSGNLILRVTARATISMLFLKCSKTTIMVLVYSIVNPSKTTTAVSSSASFPLKNLLFGEAGADIWVLD